jgi:Fic family protein
MKPEKPPLSFSDVAIESTLPDSLGLGAYKPWRTFRHAASDSGLDAVEAWRLAKSERARVWTRIPVSRAEGGVFGFAMTPEMLRVLHLIDRAVGGPRGSGAPSDPPAAAMRKRLEALLRGGELIPSRTSARTWMFEAADSSIIEGASATREQALELLRSGKTPRNRDERMIANNYEAMQLVKGFVGVPLSVEMLLEIQSVVVAGTDADHAAGRFRTAAEDIRVVDSRTDATIFVPPSAERIRGLLIEVCAFANRNPSDGASFIHPIIFASILHFLIGYVHPFADGNGRTARAIFYWHALRSGYGLFQYLSISEIIRKGYARYPQAYLDSEHDDGDLTYFILYKLNVIEHAIEALWRHLKDEEDRIKRSEALLAVSSGLNLRQRILIEHALRHPMQPYTVKSHANSNDVTPATARADLDGIVKLKLLVTEKDGREVVYRPAPLLNEKVAKAMRRKS